MARIQTVFLTPALRSIDPEIVETGLPLPDVAVSAVGLSFELLAAQAYHHSLCPVSEFESTAYAM
jgi:hypothetical protein